MKTKVFCCYFYYKNHDIVMILKSLSHGKSIICDFGTLSHTIFLFFKAYSHQSLLIYSLQIHKWSKIKWTNKNLRRKLKTQIGKIKQSQVEVSRHKRRTKVADQLPDEGCKRPSGSCCRGSKGSQDSPVSLRPTTSKARRDVTSSTISKT